MAPTQNNNGAPPVNANAYIPPRQVEVYTLREDAQIPPEYREQYQTDDEGRVLFFTAPPLNRPHPGVAESHATLGHSVGYLAGLAEHRAERERLRKERDEKLAREAEEQAVQNKAMREGFEKELGAAAGNMLGDWIVNLQRSNAIMDQELAPWRAEMAAFQKEQADMRAEEAAAKLAATQDVNGTKGAIGKTAGKQ